MKVLMWKRFVGGDEAGREAAPSHLMSEHPVRVKNTTYTKRRLCICKQRILVLCDQKMSTASACEALTKELMRRHPDTTDEEP